MTFFSEAWKALIAVIYVGSEDPYVIAYVVAGLVGLLAVYIFICYLCHKLIYSKKPNRWELAEKTKKKKDSKSSKKTSKKAVAGTDGNVDDDTACFDGANDCHGAICGADAV